MMILDPDDELALENSIAGIEPVAVPRAMTQPAFPKTGVAGGDEERPTSHFEKTASPN